MTAKVLIVEDKPAIARPGARRHRQRSPLRGGKDDDQVDGGKGNDHVYGDAGKDVVSGGIGNDHINGGEGDDDLSGEAGHDRFVFEGMFGNDTITDFDVKNDTLHINGTTYSKGNFDQLVVIEVDATTVLFKHDEDNSITRA